MAKQNVSQILQEVHTSMIQQYSNTSRIQRDIQQAEVLTNFLYQLKYRAMNRSYKPGVENLKEDIYDLILDNIQLPNNRTIGKLFQRTGKKQGFYFEDDLNAIIASVSNLANPQGKKTTFKDYSLGAEVGSTDLDLVSIVDKTAEEYIEGLTKQVKKEIDKAPEKLVMGKIDTYVKGAIVNLNATIDFPPGVLDALSNSSFTDKSYKSVGWKNGKRVELGNRNIKLGSSNTYRAVLGSMRSLGFNQRTSEYIYYAGRNIASGIDNTPPKELDEDIKRHIYHLRYLYELTGAGIIYKNYGEDFSSGAKFLVYNDPTSIDIYVVATSQIIQNILNQSIAPDNPYGNISISSAAIKAMSSSNK